MSKRRIWLWLGAPLGIVLGLGLFTLAYAKGLSYVSDAPEACINCHIMREQYDGWLKGPHHAVATCNGCRVPRLNPPHYGRGSRSSPAGVSAQSTDVRFSPK